ncbi:MAG: hypothetical protein NVSMB27_00680 [Ktedonobacteraceae bacterium]
MTPTRDPAPTPNRLRVTTPVPQQPVAISPATNPLMGARDFFKSSGGAVYTALLSVI